MNRREFLGAAGAAFSLPGQTAARKPNFLFILADDLGIPGLSCYGADEFRTPHIDQLAKGGIRYTNAYTAPLCGPSRALIMTGRYAFRTGATNQDATGRIKPEAETMIPAVLKTAGYVSTCIGKWGQLPPQGPAAFGFDDHFRVQGSGTYWNTQERGRTYTVNGETRPLKDKQYLPDLMHDHLVNFMTKNHERPFFAYYSLSHIHTDILPTPDSPADSKDLYADNVHYMDKLVGRAVSALDKLNLRENTVIVFVGDNGTGENYSDRSTIGGKRLSGAKGSMLEGGALVPMIVNWPGRAPAGKMCPDVVDSTDFLPTFAELAGAKLPAGRVIDGHSLAPQWRGGAGQPRDWVFIQLARMWYVRDSRWKLNEKGELFDMSRAPFEEPLVPADTKNSAAIAARTKLQAALKGLNPGGGILDDGDGTGRHAKRQQRRAKN